MQAIIAAFRAAGERAVDLIGSPPARGAWTAASALEGYTVGALAGHVLLATARLEIVLDEVEPVGDGPIGLAAFYGANRIDDGDEIDTGLHPVIRALASETAGRGPDAVVADLAAVLEGLRTRLPR